MKKKLSNIWLFAILLSITLACSKSDNLSTDENGNAGKEEETEQSVLFKRDIIEANYVEYRSGNAPFILTVPHGGSEDDASLTVRTEENCPDPDFTTSRDNYTIELANLIDSIFIAKTGKYPYMVIGKIRRKYVDLNRKKEYAIPTGATNNEVIWKVFNNWAEKAGTLVEDKFAAGLMLDIHGHGHAEKRVELGYLLYRSELQLSNEELAGDSKYAYKSSIYRLVTNNKSGSKFVDLLRGSNSFGSILYRNGIPCVPHSEVPDPGSLPYFRGGYNTATYGSANNQGLVDAIQLEFDSVSRQASNRKKTAEAVVNTVIEYMNRHYKVAAL